MNLQQTEDDSAEISRLRDALSSILGRMATVYGRAAKPVDREPPPRSRDTAERGLRMAEAKYRTLIELLPAVTFLATFEEGLNDAYVSPQIENLLGYSQREWLENPVLWYQRLHPDDRDRWNNEFARTVAAGEPLRSAYRFLAKNGRVVWIHTEAKIVHDESGKPVFIHGIGIDITTLKEAEQRVREYAQRLEQTNRELEQFAYVASHDLQEPLRTILSFTDLISSELQHKQDSELLRYFTRIQEAGFRMKSLIQALLEFSRVGRVDLPTHELPLEETVQEALSNLAGAIREHQAEIIVDPLPKLKIVRPYMVLLFQNLIGNALKFRGTEAPKIHISAFRTKNEWTISVSDNGLGIEPQHFKCIFEIFQRLHTQKKYSGTGVGLSICKKIIDLHGGNIWIESEPGKGSIFKFTLPIDV
jgi:PAS domain S-box-containing protein